MTNFPINEMPQYSPVNEGVEDVSEDPRSSSVADRALSMAIGLSVDPNATLEEAERGDKTSTMSAKQSYKDQPSRLFNQAVAEGNVTIEDLERAVVDSTEKAEVAQELEDFYIENGILVEGVEYTPTDLRHATNQMIAEQMFRDRISAIEDETGFVGKVGDFVDRYFLRHLPIGMVEDLTGRSERKGQELLQASLSMNPKEYREYISAYIEELSQEGFFASDNLYALQDGFDEATNAGYDPMSNLNAILAATEVVGLGKALKMGVKSRKALSTADSAIGRITAIKGQEAGAVATESALNATGLSDDLVKTKAGPGAFDPGSATIRPQSAKVLEILENNALVRKIANLNKKGTFGRVATEDQIFAAAQKIIKDYSKRVTNKLNNYTIQEDILGNSILRVDVGTNKTGAPYKSEKGAQKALEGKDAPEAYVAPVDPEDHSKGWVIRADTRIDTTGLADPFKTNAVEYDFIRTSLARLFGSNAALDDEYLTALANMGEAGQSAIKGEAATFEKALRSVKSDSRKAIVRVFKELRDGKDAALKEGYTTEEFKVEFQKNHPKGLAPTQADMDAYDALVQFEDAAWLLRANEALLRYVKKGYWALDMGDGVRTIGKRVDTLEPDTKVFNNVTGRVEKMTTIHPSQSVWKLDSPLPDGSMYVANPKDVSVLDHADVMGFNAGGRRLNPNARYFVTFDGERPRAFLTAFSEKQAKAAVDEFNKIKDKIKSLGNDIKKIKDSPELDELISQNNAWNPSIQTWKQFAELVQERGWDITKKVSYKERDGEIVDDAVDSLHKGEKWETYVKTQLHRYNDTLMDYGGEATYNVDPVSAILGEFSSATSHYANRAYTYNAAAAWTKRAAKSGSGVKLSDNYPKNDYLNQVQHAEITGNNASARSLRNQQAIIRRRLKMKGPVAERMEAFGKEASEYIFNTTGIKTNFSDPSNVLLNLGFQSAFGFFNVSQFFMQGMHATTIIALSPVQGMRAATVAIPLRMALNAGTPAAQKLATKRLAKILGEDESVAEELVEYIKTSGRDIVDGDAIELGTGPSYGISGWQEESYLPSVLREPIKKATNGGRKVLEAGLTPFRAGERLSRITGITTAFLEYKKMNPRWSALSDDGRKWITTREQNLTFNMTASARPLFQEGVMKVPTQWLSYSFRAMETMILGRGFSKGERARLAAVLLPMYGTTGMGLASATDWMVEKFGVEDPEAYIRLKYGVIDWLIAEFSPVETALSTRLAPITAFTDLYKNIVGGEATTLEVIGGPSGQIVGGAFSQLMETIGEAFNGHTVSLTEDALQVLRQPSGLDNIAKGIGILNNGLYRSKTGTIVPVELKPSDALISFFGFSPLEVSEFYSRNGGKYTSDKKLRKFKKEMLKDFQRSIQIWKDDPERGAQLMDEVHTKIALSGFSISQQRSIRRGLQDIDNRQLYELEKHLLETDKENSAMLLNKTLRGK